jgi:hypothetical protein
MANGAWMTSFQKDNELSTAKISADKTFIQIPCCYVVGVSTCKHRKSLMQRGKRNIEGKTNDKRGKL